MPLNPSGLQSALESLFADPPPSAAECAQAWSDAVASYAAGLIPTSTTVSAAAAALTGALQSAFEAPSAAAAFDAAFTVFAATVAAGQLPLFTGAPPPTPLGIAALLSVPQETHADAAAVFAALLDGWMRTGSATLVLPPNTFVPAWS
jgi:hypothetical protein